MYLNHRRCKHCLSTLFVIAILGIFALANTAWAAGSGVINSSVVNVRSGPGTSYTIAGTLMKDTHVQILQTQGEWDKIQLGSLSGWVSSSFITVSQTSTTPAKATIVTTAVPPRVLLDGKELSFEVSPLIENSRTLVPLRAIFEAMGATVKWDGAAQTVTASKGSKTVVLPLNSTNPTINGVVYPLEVTAKIINNRTLAPLRFVGEAFDGTINWDAASRTISIASSQGSTLPAAVIVNDSIVNLRSGPSTSYDKVGTATVGQLMTVLAQKDGWYQVNYGSQTAWIANWLVKAATETSAPDPTQTPTPTPVPVPTPMPRPTQPDSSIKLNSSRDENGIKITMQSEIALTPKITQSSGQVVYTFKGHQLTGLNYIKQDLGSDSLTAQAGSNANGTTITFKLPAQIKYNSLNQDGGKTLIFSVPNYIISLQPSDFGTNGEKIVLSTLCPVKYTSRQNGDQVQVILSNILQGQAESEYDVNSQYLDSIKLVAGNASQPGITLNMTTHNVDQVSFGVSGANNDMNIILTKKTNQQQGDTSASYEVVQEYIDNNRPGKDGNAPLNPTGQVVHSTADPGATAQNIRDYFNNHPNAQASAHATIDWNSIIEMIPENEVAWHAGSTANSQFLSFEMCEPANDDPDRYSKFQEVWNRAVWYCAKTCVKYGWNTNDNIFSHNYISQMYHETKHTDPYGYFATYGKTWHQFLTDVDAEIAEEM